MQELNDRVSKVRQDLEEQSGWRQNDGKPNSEQRNPS